MMTETQKLQLIATMAIRQGTHLCTINPVGIDKARAIIQREPALSAKEVFIRVADDMLISAMPTI